MYLCFFICSLDDDGYLCVCDEEARGVGGKYGSVTVALMSHECLDETLCVAEVIQSGRLFLCRSELHQILSSRTS